MPRYPNPYYTGGSPYPTDPAWSGIGASLGKALFGDPQAAQDQAESKALVAQRQAAAAYDTSRTASEDQRRNGRSAWADDVRNGGIYGADPAAGSTIPVAPNTAPAGLADAMLSGAPSAPPPVDQEPAGPVAAPPADVPGLIKSLFPSIVVTSGARTPERNAEVGGAPNSYHLTTRGGRALDVLPVPGMTFQQWHDALDAAGIPVREAIDETHRAGHGAHWHVAWDDAGNVDPSRTVASDYWGSQGVPNMPAAPQLQPEPGSPPIDQGRLANLFADMVQSGADPLDYLRAETALRGGDQGARASLIMAGHQPTDELAASRPAALNNMAISNGAALAKAVVPANISAATSRANNAATNTRALQQTGMQQAGEDRRNAARIAAGQSGADLDDATLNDLADTYNLTGRVPPGLARAKGALPAILNRASERANGVSVGDRIAGQAGRAADSKSLAQLQKQTDAMAAFESTATANGKAAMQRIAQAGGPSTVAAWNRWVQAGRRGFTDPNVRALDVAMNTFATEYGKAMGGGANGNAALTDSARREAQEYFSSAMTPQEFGAAYDAALTDMRNRREAYQNELQGIRGRIRGPVAPSSPSQPRTPPAGSTKTATGPNGAKLALVGGKWTPY